MLADRLDRYSRLRKHLLHEYTTQLEGARQNLKAYTKDPSIRGGFVPSDAPLRIADENETDARFIRSFPPIPDLASSFLTNFDASGPPPGPLCRFLESLLGG
jgi:hypothetical protein